MHGAGWQWPLSGTALTSPRSRAGCHSSASRARDCLRAAPGHPRTSRTRDPQSDGQRPGARRRDRRILTYTRAFAKAWHQNGASILGGCCGIGPEHIHALRRGLPAISSN
ncbi:MAG: homocysteine S-methyltransferase family protein [Acetobacteraceae bacterium]|nr:homocysteine S-methyltransferase family protein [Acetobacteraceae bacterium]